MSAVVTQPTTTSLDPADQAILLHALQQAATPAGARNFCAVLWQYLSLNYHSQQSFNAFLVSLATFAFSNITVNQIMIGKRARLRSLSNGAVLELLGYDNNWHAQQTFIVDKPQ